MAGQSNQEKFDQVRALVREEKFDEARLLLITMRDTPKAQEWLTRLNRIAPPAAADPTVAAKVSQAEIAAQVASALDDYKRQQRTRRNRWRVLRLVGILAFFACQCAWILPLLSFVGAVTGGGVPGAPAMLTNTLGTVMESPLGAMIESQLEPITAGIANQVFSVAGEQITPMLTTMCRQQGLSGQELAMCEQMMNGIGACMSGTGQSPAACLEESFEDLCREVVGNSPQDMQRCMSQLGPLMNNLP